MKLKYIERPALREPNAYEKDCLRAIAANAILEAFNMEDFDLAIAWHPEQQYPGMTRESVDYYGGNGWDMAFGYSVDGKVVVHVYYMDEPPARPDGSSPEIPFWAEYTDAWELL